jgi:hypothetical protein
MKNVSLVLAINQANESLAFDQVAGHHNFIVDSLILIGFLFVAFDNLTGQENSVRVIIKTDFSECRRVLVVMVIHSLSDSLSVNEPLDTRRHMVHVLTAVNGFRVSLD